MSRIKKPGRRAKGVQGKGGKLYVVIPIREIKAGKIAYTSKWVCTEYEDIPTNVKKAMDYRSELMRSGEHRLKNMDSSVKDYVISYLNVKKRIVADTTYATYYQHAQIIMTHFGDIPISKIKVKDVNDFLDSLCFESGEKRPGYNQKRKAFQYRTIKDVRRFLIAVIEEAVKDEIRADNPAKESSINKTLTDINDKHTHDGSNFFTASEAKLFVELLLEEIHPLRFLFIFILILGLRREEALGLRWCSVDFVRKTITIEHTVTKGTRINRLNHTKTKASKRTYLLNDKMISWLMDIKADENHYQELFGNTYIQNDYIFKNINGKPYYPDSISKSFKKFICKHPELPQNITLHGLRKSCASILIDMGNDPTEAQIQLGHTDVDTTLSIYRGKRDQTMRLNNINDMIDILGLN